MADEKIHVNQELPPEQKETAQELVEPKVYAGKYKTPEDLESAYGEASKKIGSQGNELGKLKAQNELLAKQLNETQTQAQQREEQARVQEPPTDYEKMLREIGKQVDSGDLNYEDGLLKSNAITAQMVRQTAEVENAKILETALSKFDETLQQRDTEAATKSFNEKNPEFQEWTDSGAIEKVMASDPMHDEFSAFYALKAEQAFEKGKQEAVKLAEGSRAAESVMADKGTSMQTNKQTKKLSAENDLKESMLAALG